MATLEFTPLYHSTVGFDRLPSVTEIKLKLAREGYQHELVERS